MGNIMLKNTTFNGRCKKQVPFLSKAVHKRVRGWRSGRQLPFVK